jgi:hypothetical protein
MVSIGTIWRFVGKSSPVRACLILLCSYAALPSFLALTGAFAAENSNAKVKVDWPSPDGKFAFRTSYAEYLRTIDLIDNKSGKKLQQIDQVDMSSVYYDVLWAPDSQRFALMTRVGHPNQGVDVYFRSGGEFRKIELADQLPKADIPDKLRRGKEFPHVASNNWQQAEAWNKDGSLVVTIDTTIDGAGSSIEAKRTVALTFDRAGKVKILKSSIKYETEND